MRIHLVFELECWALLGQQANNAHAQSRRQSGAGRAIDAIEAALKVRRKMCGAAPD
jgi:hypothetical protein